MTTTNQALAPLQEAADAAWEAYRKAVDADDPRKWTLRDEAIETSNAYADMRRTIEKVAAIAALDRLRIGIYSGTSQADCDRQRADDVEAIRKALA